MTIETQFNFWQTVVLKHDREKNLRMVTGISIRDGNLISYHLLCGNNDSWHYEDEIELPGNGQRKAGF